MCAPGTLSTPQLMDVPVDKIIVRDRLRKVLPDRVEAFLVDYRAQGLLTPIDLVEIDTGPRLIFGALRLAAVIEAGDSTIRALMHPRGTFGSEADIRLREISENFVRFELTALERAVYIAEWRSIYETANPPARPGRKKRTSGDEALEELSANFALNFTDTVQKTLGLSRRAIFLALKVATIEPAARDAIAAHPIANNQSELLALASQDAFRQASIVGLLTATAWPTANSVAEALAVLDQLPPPRAPKPYERISSGFSRLKEPDQYRFFDLHADAVTRWLAVRGK